MNIDELQAGRELDALVAEKVMGWRVKDWRDETDGGSYWVDSVGEPVAKYSIDKNPKWRWSPSTDIAAAWQAVEKMGLLTVTDTYLPALNFRNGLWTLSSICFSDWETVATADTVPLAICRAALKAVME